MDAQKRIRQLMEERDWTDYKLAKESNISHSTVANLAQFFSEGDNPAALTEEQRILFSRWSTLTEEQKQILLDLMRTM